MEAVTGRIRLYSALMAKSAEVLGTQAFRWMGSRQECPMGWPKYQEWCVAMMKTLFEVGSYQHWRNFIKLMMVSFSVPELQLTLVPPSTFETKGFRSSWWVDLKPALQPQHPKTSVVIMYLHGGAFVAGDPLMYKPAYLEWMQQLAGQGIHARVFAVGYPLAPEHTFPAGLRGVVEAYDWLVQQLGGSHNIILAGDSAGGNLTITALAYMRDRAHGTLHLNSTAPVAADAAPAVVESAQQPDQQPKQAASYPPLAAMLISPATDFTSNSVFGKRLPASAPASADGAHSSTQSSSTNTASAANSTSGQVRSINGGSEHFKWDYVSPGEGNDVIKLYLPEPHNPQGLAHPFVSPINIQNFSGLVKKGVLVITGGCEAMVPDIVRFVDKMQETSSDVAVQHHIEKNEPHCYCMLSMDHLVKKGAVVVVPFMATMCTDKM